MHISLFDYHLPKELIAYYPAQKRDESKMLVYIRKEDKIIHTFFKNLPDFLDKNDIIIANNVKVIPAKILGKKETGGKVEILLIRKIGKNRWEAFLKASKIPKHDQKILINKDVFCNVCSKLEDRFIIEFSENFVLEKYGKIPLPPYIKREIKDIDFQRYQTIFADNSCKGAIASPTAGLHFTEDVLKNLKKKGIIIGFITLYVSYATFKPVKVENIKEHKMHYEDYEIPLDTEKLINENFKKKNIVAVGTTVVRALEDNYLKFKKIKHGNFSTNLFIYPGFKFNIVDKLITNFHLPKSTLLMLVSAFAGREKILKCYREAISKKYRFFSYGDCMLIL